MKASSGRRSGCRSSGWYVPVIAERRGGSVPREVTVNIHAKKNPAAKLHLAVQIALQSDH